MVQTPDKSGALELSIEGKLLTLRVNIPLELKLQKTANTPAYYGTDLIAAAKSFMVHAPDKSGPIE